MSRAEVQRFAADLKSNASLRQEIGNITADPLDAIVGIAQRQGYSFTLDEARGHIQAKALANGQPMSDADLDGITGGVTSPSDAINAAGSAMKSAGEAIGSGVTSAVDKIASWF
jgi:predicted ribosomally synthesized peptide with nif11-like leader